MAGIAKITLVGNLGRDPETRYTPNGKMNVTFTMAVSRRFNDQSGQQQERTNWYRVTAWGGLAETLDRMAQNGYLAKVSRFTWTVASKHASTRISRGKREPRST